MSKKTIKIRNVSGWEQNVRNPHMTFLPDEEYEVNYDLGSKLVLQPDFEVVYDVPLKSRKKIDKKKGDEK